MFRVEFLLISFFGIKNPIFFIVLRIVELYFLYALNKRYNFLFKQEIIILNFFETFFLFISVLFFFYFILLYFQYYIFTLPVLYFTFILNQDEKDNFYQKILRYLNKNNNNPDWVFVKEQLECFNYFLVFCFFLLYIGDLSNLENIEIIMVLGLRS